MNVLSFPVISIARRAIATLVVRPLYVVAEIAVRVLPAAAAARLYQHCVRFLPLDFSDATLVMRVDSELAIGRLASCRKEPETVEWLRCSLDKGDVLYDIGANVGAYSLVGASLVGSTGRVVAIEPVFANYNALCANTLANKFNSFLLPLCTALGSGYGIVSMTLSSPFAGAASHSMSRQYQAADRSGHDNTSQCIQIPCIALDDLVATLGLPAPTAMKIDVDGAELAVLQGAQATLRSQSLQHLLVEVDSTTDAAEPILALLRNAGWGHKAIHPRNAPGVHNYIFARILEDEERLPTLP